MTLEYTHNDDVADMIYAKEQEIKLLEDAMRLILLLNKQVDDASDEIERLRRIVTMMVNDYTIEYGHTFERNLKMIEMSAEEQFEREKKNDE
jgi:hypothetical protein